MLYILEGCDGSGKTTLAKCLATLLDAEIIHCSTHTVNDITFFNKIVEAARNRNIVADRFCYGQFVYQTEEERPLKGTYFNSEQALQSLEMTFLQNKVKVILVDAPTSIIEERLKQRNETLINGLSVSEVQHRFRELKRKSLLTWLEYNTGGDGIV